jgi:predicted dehydrogenase
MTDRPSRSGDPVTRRQFHAAALAAGQAVAACQAFAALDARASEAVPGALDRIRIGVIGCGGRGTHHIRNLLSMRDAGEKIEVAAVCDTYRPRLEAAARISGAAFKTMVHEDLVARKDLDLVLVATPDHWHGPQAIDSLRAGKDVYCEKPLVHWRQLGLPERIVQAARETGRLVQVGCQRMSSTAYSQARELIRAGAIGRLLMAQTGYYRLGDWGERGMPIDDPAARPGPDLDWERFQGDSPRRDFDPSRYFRWRMYWEYSGGPATDNYVHFYAPLAYMLDLGYPDQVIASGGKYRYEEREVPDTFNMIADYPGRSSASGRIAVLCDGTQGNDFQAPGSGESPLVRGWEGTLAIEGAQIVVRPVGEGGPEKRIPVEAGTDEKRFWKELLDCARTRKEPRSGAALNAAVTTTMQMAIAAMREGKVVRWDQERQTIR